MNHLDIGLLDGQPVRHRNSSTRPAVVLAVLSSVAVFGFWAATSFNRWRGWSQREREHEEALIRLHAFLNDRPELLMPTMELPPAFRPHPSATINLEDASADHRSLPPVVFLHGEGDAGNNPGMQSVCKTASDAYPGLYVVCANVANGVASISTPLTEQVEEFSNLVRADKKLSAGFNAVGFSQGGLVIRGYIERKNDPPVRRFISLCAPHGGVSSCTSTSAVGRELTICDLWKLAPYTARLAFADYWKDASNPAEYLSRSRWLAWVNNERETKIDLYRQNMMRLERYVLIEATNDTTVTPHVSESHGFFAWGGRRMLQLRETEGYQKDFIGLKTLDESHRLFEHSFEGDHLAFSSDFWARVVLPHLGP